MLVSLAALLLAGCATKPLAPELEPRPFELRHLVKSDVDSVIEVHQRQLIRHLRELTGKLYRRNPRQLRKDPRATLSGRLEAIYSDGVYADFPALNGLRGLDCLRLAFREDFPGDRVLAFSVGLADMLMKAYGHKTEFNVFDELDPQDLYNSARNVEVAVWKLSNDRHADGTAYLLSNSRPGELRNLSFERLFGRIVATQDNLALIIADKSNRRIRHAVRSLVPVFLPF